jgi:hypothetical protein
LASGQPVLPLDNIKQTGSDIKSTFAQFCSFVAMFEPMADGSRSSFPPELLLSSSRLLAFVTFMVQAGKAPQTIKNKILHLQQGLALLDSKRSLAAFQARIRQARYALKGAAKQAASAIGGRIMAKPKEAYLIANGQFFYPQERIVFSKWVIAGGGLPNCFSCADSLFLFPFQAWARCLDRLGNLGIFAHKECDRDVETDSRIRQLCMQEVDPVPNTQPKAAARQEERNKAIAEEAEEQSILIDLVDEEEAPPPPHPSSPRAGGPASEGRGCPPLLATLQTLLMTTTLELIGGQRRQVVVGIRKDSIR